MGLLQSLLDGKFETLQVGGRVQFRVNTGLTLCGGPSIHDTKPEVTKGNHLRECSRIGAPVFGGKALSQRNPKRRGTGPPRDVRHCSIGRILLPLFLAALLAAAPAVAPPPPGPPSYPPVLITINPPNPRAGDTLMIDVYTYRGGLPTDADATPDVYVGPPLERLPTFAHVGTGHYRGSLTLPVRNASRDWPASFQSAGLEVFANITGTSAIRFLGFNWFDPGLYLRMSVDKSAPSAGDTVAVRAEAFKEGVRVDPDNLTMSLDIASGYHADGVPSRESLGVYTASFSLPPFSPAYLMITFRAVAYLGEEEFRQAVTVQIARYQVWFHGTSITNTSARGVLWVADETGALAPGVAIHVLVNGIVMDGATDARGAFPVSLDFPASGAIHLSGSVAQGTPRENAFVTSLYSSEYPFASVVPLDPALLSDETPRDFLRPGQPVSRTFRLIDRSPWRNRSFADTDLDFAVWTSREVVAYGRVHADAEATVRVSFETPERDASLAFVPDVGPPLEPVTYRVGSRDVALNVSALTLGGATRVRASVAPALKDTWDAQSYAYFRSEVRLLSPSPGERWARWTDGLGDSLYLAPDGMVRDYGLPAFLPHDGKWLVAVSVSMNLEPMTQFAVLGDGEVAGIPLNTTYEGPSGTTNPSLDVLVVVAIAVGIVIVSAAAWIVLRRRRRPAQPPLS